jgi:hypothetical protein
MPCWKIARNTRLELKTCSVERLLQDQEPAFLPPEYHQILVNVPVEKSRRRGQALCILAHNLISTLCSRKMAFSVN